MFGLGKAAAKASDFALGTEFSDQYEYQPEVEEQLAPTPAAPIVVTAKQVGIVKPFVKDPQRDFNHLVELFGVLGEPTKYIICSCPECGYEEKGLHSEFSSTAMDEIVACSDCGHDDEFAEFYDRTITEFTTSRHPTLHEIVITVGDNDPEDYDLEDSYYKEYFERVRTGALKYYAILSGKAEVEHPGGEYGPVELDRSGAYLVKHKRGWSSRVDDLKYFGMIKSLQAVNAAASSNGEDFDDE